LIVLAVQPGEASLLPVEVAEAHAKGQSHHQKSEFAPGPLRFFLVIFEKIVDAGG
jgi:hypothetical protein